MQNSKGSDANDVGLQEGDPLLQDQKDGVYQGKNTLQDKIPLGRRIATAFFTLVTVTILGMVFGWCAQKSMVYEPLAIRLQFVFQNFEMLKLFLGAIAGGQIVFFILCLANRGLFNTVRAAFMGCMERKGVVGTALGAALLGAGMALGGGCPGMVLAQVGSGVPLAYVSLLGCFTGALLYGLLEKPLLKMAMAIRINQKYCVAEGQSHSRRTPFFLLACCLCLGGAVALIEVLSPWSTAVTSLIQPDVLNATGSLWGRYIVDAVSWPAWMCGLIIGLLQLPLCLLVKDSLGSSTSYMLLISQWVHALPERHRQKFPEMDTLAKQSHQAQNWWQVLYVVGVVLGSFVSSFLSSTYGTAAKGVYPVEGFVGGILMLFGSRLAAGCTSGHGLSGMALLVTYSIIAVPFMFAGGIITAFTMQAVGSITPSVQW
mmetsp:Transcript_39061/g.100088  ORF Transcript_39061/g.100088 Transcript_39061/m.100088 type:complete len:429 (-) Transcript_39061:325-1611(-)|eukprot:CAMPEP_0113887670 /NCGR_PEP_ID=MMETSP0780_2-20120614/12357_1 /TAXON_ID=652834 /ORGANISM="Palpitomonas bilix" /LENGTH=428 /DNA_ID=CAMNT_0000876257 /DNA_START=26 /DNA_END=1309 /DNA_ORIENTATION=- /assembly_acc=CAM_ASM_000599